MNSLEMPCNNPLKSKHHTSDFSSLTVRLVQSLKIVE